MEQTIMLKFISKRIFLILLSILLNACVSVSATPASTVTSPPLPTFAPASTSPSQTPAGTALDFNKVVALELPDSFIHTILFSPDGSTMITGNRNGEVLFWERVSWNKTVFLPARSTGADDEEILFYGTPLAFEPGRGIMIQAYGEDGGVTARDLAGDEVFTFSYGASVYSLALEGNRLVHARYRTN
jgi:hypothetical protein